ncbi:MAG: hypothetical protein AB8B56_10175 [Crocinitomicaceae bacterium]
MKRLKLILSSLTIAALGLSAWSLYVLFSGEGDLVQAALNLTYFFTLFIAFLCVRISMGESGKVTWLTYFLSIIVIISSTYTWISSVDLLLTGKYTIGLLPILIGTTMISTVSSNVSWSKYVQAVIGLIALALSVCVFTGTFGTSIYDILLVGMIILTVIVFALSFFAKPT